MSIGTSSCTLTCTPTAAVPNIVQGSDINQFLHSISLSIAGLGAGKAANLVMQLLRGTAVVQTVSGFGGTDPYTKAMDTNVTTIAAIFSGVKSGDIRVFKVQLWDSASGEKLAEGPMEIQGNDATYSGTIAPDPVPTPGGWVHLGDDWYNGSDHYRVNQANGKLRKVWTTGEGDDFHEVFDDSANEIDVPTT